MDQSESKDIAQAWLKFQSNWWAWDRLDELCRKDHAGAWSVLKELVEEADSAELLEDIGVGPLEDFVNYYAADYIDELEQTATDSEAFAKALSFSTLRDAQDPMAERVAALGCRTANTGKQTDAFDDPIA